MNRRGFLGRLAALVPASLVARKVVADELPVEMPEPGDIIECQAADVQPVDIEDGSIWFDNTNTCLIAYVKGKYTKLS